MNARPGEGRRAKSRRSSWLAWGIGAATVVAVGCSSTPEDFDSTSAAANARMSREEVVQNIEPNIVQLCALAAIELERGEKRCEADTLVGVCSLVLDKAASKGSAAINEYLGQSELAGASRRSPDEVKTALASELEQCINGSEYRIADLEEKLRTDPELLELVRQGRARLEHQAIRLLGRLLIASAVAEKGKVLKAMRRVVVWAACSKVMEAGVDFLEDDLKGQSSTLSCMRTAGDACGAMAGMINVEDWHGIEASSDQEWITYAQDAVSLGLTAACATGGPAGFIACGAISASIKQIRLALQTGTNDWYQCLPASWRKELDESVEAFLFKYWYGLDRWTNNMPIATPRRAFTASGAEITVRPCCVCDRVDLERGWFSTREVARSNYVEVIQMGGFEGGNCDARNGREFVDDLDPHWTDGSRRLHRYESCRQVIAKGDRCVLPLTAWDEWKKRAGETLR